MSGRPDLNRRPHVPHECGPPPPGCGVDFVGQVAQVLPKTCVKAAVLGLLLCLVPLVGVGQPARTFEVLGGSTHPDSLRQGTMLTLTEWRITGSDTLRVWAERTTPKSPPSRKAAQEADRVVWCYPGEYPDRRHLFPEAHVVLSFAGQQEGASLIMFVTEEAYRRHYAGDLGWQALALH